LYLLTNTKTHPSKQLKFAFLIIYNIFILYYNESEFCNFVVKVNLEYNTFSVYMNNNNTHAIQCLWIVLFIIQKGVISLSTLFFCHVFILSPLYTFSVTLSLHHIHFPPLFINMQCYLIEIQVEYDVIFLILSCHIINVILNIISIVIFQQVYNNKKYNDKAIIFIYYNNNKIKFLPNSCLLWCNNKCICKLNFNDVTLWFVTLNTYLRRLMKKTAIYYITKYYNDKKR
jgi:hypothetical protein